MILLSYFLASFLFSFFKDKIQLKKYSEQNIGTTFSVLGIYKVKNETLVMSKIVKSIFKKVRIYLKEDNSPRSLTQIKNNENSTDEIKLSVDTFLTKLMSEALSKKEAREVKMIFSLVSELESIADYLDKLATYKTRLEEQFSLRSDLEEEFFRLFDQVESYFDEVIGSFNFKDDKIVEKLDEQAHKLRRHLEKMRLIHIQRLEAGDMPASFCMTYSDMVVALRKIRGHIRHISNSLGNYNLLTLPKG